MSESGGSESKTKFYKGNIYDLGLNLPAAETKKIFNTLRASLLSSQGTIDEYDIISGGESLMNYRDKYTKMNIIQYAFSSKIVEVDKDEFIFQNGVNQSQNSQVSFLKKLKKLRGKAFLMDQCLTL